MTSPNKVPTTLTLQQAMDLAVQHHQAGRLRDAEEIYRRILEVDPNNMHVLHLLGVLASQVGHGEAALDLIRRAIVLNPTSAIYHSNLGAALATLGRWEEAIEVQRRALLLQADLLDAHANLGTALCKVGKVEEGIASLRRAVALAPDDFRHFDALGRALCEVGHPQEALPLFARAISLRSDYAPAHYGLGNALTSLGRDEEATAAFRMALSIRPDFPEALTNLAALLCDRGGLDESIALARRALALQPRLPQAYFSLGNALHKQNRLDEAIEAFNQVITLDPRHFAAHNNLANSWLSKQMPQQAIAALQPALALQPNGFEPHYNLGNALHMQGKLEEALAAYRHAQTLREGYAPLHNNIGTILMKLGQREPATASFHDALRMQPDFPLARLNLGMIHLLQGQYRQGWEGYEYRWQASNLVRPKRYGEKPVWDGGDLAGKRILLDCEQGFGDAIQFVRYAPLVAQRGGHVTVTCQPELGRLFKTVSGVEAIVLPGDNLPPFELQCPLLSLGRVLGTTLETIPTNVPYIFADAGLEQRWRLRVAQAEDRFKVGLVWSGSATHQTNAFRSPFLAEMVPLGQVEGAWFCSLQKGDAAKEAMAPPSGLSLVDWTAELQDFADTAALMANLDLIITSDTAVAHLAGAMGKPVWTLLAYSAHWAWLLDRSDSPWYPTMRLFRQSKLGDWRTPVGQVVDALKARLAQ